MESLTLNNGIEMPALGLGVFQTPPAETRAAVRAALDAGYRHVDTAAAYANERQVGSATSWSSTSRGSSTAPGWCRPSTRSSATRTSGSRRCRTSMRSTGSLLRRGRQLAASPSTARVAAAAPSTTRSSEPSPGPTERPRRTCCCAGPAARTLGHSQVHQTQPHCREHRRVRLRAVDRRNGRDRRPGYRPSRRTPAGRDHPGGFRTRDPGGLSTATSRHALNRDAGPATS